MRASGVRNSLGDSPPVSQAVGCTKTHTHLLQCNATHQLHDHTDGINPIYTQDTSKSVSKSKSTSTSTCMGCGGRVGGSFPWRAIDAALIGCSVAWHYTLSRLVLRSTKSGEKTRKLLETGSELAIEQREKATHIQSCSKLASPQSKGRWRDFKANPNPNAKPKLVSRSSIDCSPGGPDERDKSDKSTSFTFSPFNAHAVKTLSSSQSGYLAKVIVV